MNIQELSPIQKGINLGNILTDGVADVHIRPSLIICNDIISFRGDGFIMFVIVPDVVFYLNGTHEHTHCCHGGQVHDLSKETHH